MCVCVQDKAAEATRRKEREVRQKENDKLRATIQQLTRGVNPMSKLLDFVQEDLDAMQKEMDMWKRENKDNETALRRENKYVFKGALFFHNDSDSLALDKWHTHEQNCLYSSMLAL